MKDEALRQALDYITATNKNSTFWLVPQSELNKTVTAIKQALEQPEPEPVATVYEGAIAKWNLPDKFTGFLYTSPPKREWQGLTDEDRQAAFESMPDMLDGFLKLWGWLHFSKAIEAKLKEKNT